MTVPIKENRIPGNLLIHDALNDIRWVAREMERLVTWIKRHQEYDDYDDYVHGGRAAGRIKHALINLKPDFPQDFIDYGHALWTQYCRVLGGVEKPVLPEPPASYYEACLLATIDPPVKY